MLDSQKPRELPSQDEGVYYLAKVFPISLLYKLFVDERFMIENNLNDIPASLITLIEYERREPGCSKAMIDSYSLLLDHAKDEEVTVELIIKLHTTVTSNVGGLVKGTNPGQIRSGKERGITFLRFSKEEGYIDEKGVEEIFDWMAESKLSGNSIAFDTWNRNISFYVSETIYQVKEKTDLQDVSKYYDQDTKTEIIFIPEDINERHALAQEVYKLIKSKLITNYYPPSGAAVGNELEKITKSYNEQMKISDSATPKEKLDIIIKHIQQYERLHPFFDANGRVFINLLLNYMLMKNGFPPATFYEPNIFDALLSRERMTELVIKAMERTVAIIELGNKAKYINETEFTSMLEKKFLEEEFYLVKGEDDQLHLKYEANFTDKKQAEAMLTENIKEWESFVNQWKNFQKDITQDFSKKAARLSEKEVGLSFGSMFPAPSTDLKPTPDVGISPRDSSAKKGK